jgi:DNA methylase
VTRLLGDRKPFLMITDPPDGIELDSEWRDRAGLNGCGPAQASYMKHRTEGQTETTISGDTRADWSEAFALVPSLQIALRLARQRSYARGSGWPPTDRISASPANNMGQTAHGSDPSPKFIMGGSDEEKYDHPTQKPIDLMRRPLPNHTKRSEWVYEPFVGSGTTPPAAELTERVCYGIELDPKYVDVAVKRWQGLSGQQAVLDGDGRTFEEIAEERRKAA